MMWVLAAATRRDIRSRWFDCYSESCRDPSHKFDAGIDALDCIRCGLSLLGEQIGYTTMTNLPPAFVTNG